MVEKPVISTFGTSGDDIAPVLHPGLAKQILSGQFICIFFTYFLISTIVRSGFVINYV